MAAYCKCKICIGSPAQPAKGSVNATPETAAGKLVQLGPDEVLAHWSSRDFSRMMSSELANISLRGVNPKAVCASFYLYRGGNPPQSCPPQLKILGLGGNNRYLIRSAAARMASIYLKNADTNDPKPEVVVVLGCGGYIDFNPEKEATGITRLEAGMRG